MRPIERGKTDGLTDDNDDLELLELGERGHEPARYGRGDAAYCVRRVSVLGSMRRKE